jgi:hypothetical protein
MSDQKLCLRGDAVDDTLIARIGDQAKFGTQIDRFVDLRHLARQFAPSMGGTYTTRLSSGWRRNVQLDYISLFQQAG